MKNVTVSPKFQIVIPKEVRQQAGIRPGQKMTVFQIGDIIELAPVKDVKTLRGSLAGLRTEVDRTERSLP
ncbi:MAG TPA: AbrB/MazE/SpoVT family DNA-binding domain-containing protein [Candidatus Hydrogenedentes bacterium]|nr:MAG: SpoVT / AbrB like domain protein [Candidatus Hydrogenedentes bacterium ADurb.Bin179]HOH29683.1 AbrB/MazE/SpoVT family DNA-binding domain-containing protein [Candidatus Hydrogenedentota bacterium]